MKYRESYIKIISIEILFASELTIVYDSFKSINNILKTSSERLNEINKLKEALMQLRNKP
jgi:hypothetical protein